MRNHLNIFFWAGCFILFIPLAISSNITRIDMPSKGTFEITMEPEHTINLTILSKINKPFGVTVYTPEGRKYYFKGVRMNYIGQISYIEMENTINDNNKIKIIQEQVSNTKQVSLYDMIMTSISIVTFLLTILTDKSRVTKALILLLIVMEFYNSFDNLIETSNKIRKNIIRF